MYLIINTVWLIIFKKSVLLRDFRAGFFSGNIFKKLNRIGKLTVCVVVGIKSIYFNFHAIPTH